MPSDRPQTLIFCYHKTGTVLMRTIFAGLAARLGLRFAEMFGRVQAIPAELDIVLLGHGLVGFALDRPWRGVRLVRDPREIWTSGYLYHRRCAEPWCVTGPADPAPPIRFPNVPGVIEHRTERFKRGWIARLGGRSYQQMLRDLDREAGLRFELGGYTGVTLEDMAAWRLVGPAVLEMQLEAVMTGFDAQMERIFRHLGFAGDQLALALELAAAEDIGRMAEAAIAANPHIHSRSIAKWPDFLPPALLGEFMARHGGLVATLGYPAAGPFSPAAAGAAAPPRTGAPSPTGAA